MKPCVAFLCVPMCVRLQLITPIVMRCRAFMPVGVGLQLVIADPNATAFVDKGRLGQIITNGLRCGHFTSS